MNINKWERKLSELFKRKKHNMPRIVKRSNVIQLDEMGYPLRLCIFSAGEQRWVDTYDEIGDVILEWKK